MNKYQTIESAAKESGFSECQIHALIINKKIKFKYSKPTILVDRNSLNEYIDDNWGLAELMRKPTNGDFSFFISLGIYIDDNGRVLKAPNHP